MHRSSDGYSTRNPSAPPASLIRSRSRVFATTPPPRRNGVDPPSLRRSDRLRDLHVHDRFLERGGDVGERDVVAGRLLRSQVVGGPRSSARSSRSRDRPSPPSPEGIGSRVGSPSAAIASSAGPPGNPRPRSLATLSNASPAASSRVWPSSSWRWTSGMCTSIVCPPETTRATYGGSGFPCSRKFAQMWPSRWFTPIRGTRAARETAFAAAIPTRRAPTRPGPTVTATPSRVRNPTSASPSACSSKGFSDSTCARAATSGTTPPKRSCRCSWRAMRFALTWNTSSTIATAVSSHDVSMPSVITRGARPGEGSPRSRPGAAGRPRSSRRRST